MRIDESSRGLLRVSLLLCGLSVLGAVSCSVIQGKGAQAPQVGQGNTLSAAPAGTEDAAPSAREHPRISSLSPLLGGTPGVIDALEPATDEQGQALTGGSVNLAEQGAELASTGGMSWVVYSVTPATAAVPDQLQLKFASRDGAVWAALPDFTKGRWDWIQLDSGTTVQVAFNSASRMKDGATYVTLAVHGGATAVFSGGALYNLAAGPPTPDVGAGPSAKLPDVIGAYLSMGYWDAATVDATMTELERLGVNLVLDYALIPPEDANWQDAFQHYLDTAQAHHIGIAFYVEPQLYGMTPDAPGSCMENTVALVESLKDQSAITAWYVHDEVLPDVQNDWGSGRYAQTLSQMQHLYSMIHTADPCRPQLNVWCYLPGFAEFRDTYMQFAAWGQQAWMKDEAAYERALADLLQTTCDWVMIDDYPVGAPWGAGDAVAEVVALTQRAAGLKAQQQPLVFVFQSFSWEQYDAQGAAGAPFPTREEMDSMLSAAHLSGATGAVAYSWFDLTGSEPNQIIAGRDTALEDTRLVLAALGKSGWPEVPVPLSAVELPGADKSSSALAHPQRHPPRPARPKQQ
jgi:hypothetical protein